MEKNFEQLNERFNDLNDYTPKKLRTLRNNLNNRISHFASSGNNPSELKPSHRLYGLGEIECKELLSRVREILNKA